MKMRMPVLSIGGPFWDQVGQPLSGVNSEVLVDVDDIPTGFRKRRRREWPAGSSTL